MRASWHLLVMVMLDSVFKSAASAGAIFAATFAFFALPLLRFAEPALLMVCGFGIAAFAAFAWFLLRTRPNRHMLGLHLVSLFLALFFMAKVFREAERASLANDRRCAAVQRDMLSARPRMKDAPAVFQALACRPQGFDARISVPPTARELRAKRPLPDGGYPAGGG